MTVSVGLGTQVAGLTKSIFQMVGGVIYFGEIVTWLVRPRPRDAIIRIMRTRIPIMLTAIVITISRTHFMIIRTLRPRTVADASVCAGHRRRPLAASRR